MDKQVIIAISREYGSGGHEIAKIRDLTFMTEVCLMKLPEKKILRLNILKSTTRNQKKHIFPEESVHIPIL